MKTTTQSASTTVTLDEPGELLAALPHLLGFHPVDSIILIAHRGANGSRLGTVVRADLPHTCYSHGLAEQMVAAIEGGTVASTIVVIGHSSRSAEEAPSGCPHTALVGVVREALGKVGIDVANALWAQQIQMGQRWYCYLDSTRTGLLPDPDSTVMAAATINAGLVTFSSRDAMRDLLRPDDDAAHERRAAKLSAALRERDGWQDSQWATDRGWKHVHEALRRARQGDCTVSDDQVVELALALSQASLRDACLAMAVTSDGTMAGVAEQLWLALVRAFPAPERAEAACLLGYSAYLRGDGALAGMAFDVALESCQGHVLAGLLSRALAHAIPPSTLRRLGRVEGVDDLWDWSAAPEEQDRCADVSDS